MSRLENEDKFGKDWRAAIEDLRIHPPKSVWNGIDRSLAYTDITHYRKKAAYYKWAAIIAVLIAVTISIPYTTLKNKQGSPIITSSSSNDGASTLLIPLFTFVDNDRSAAMDQGETDRWIGDISTPKEDYIVARKSIATISLRKKSLANREIAIDGFTIDPVPFYHFEMLSANRTNKDKFWAGVGVGSSSFDPNYQLNTSNVVADALLSSQPNFINTSNQAQALSDVSEEINQGTNYQIGLNLGMRLAKRWTLEGGMQYGEALLSTTTNVIIENRYFSKAIALTSEATSFQEVENMAKSQEIVEYVEEDVVMDNNFQFASFPVKAGYIVLDKKINIRLNAGLVTNIYLGNTLKDPESNLATIEISPGDNSPYRTVNFSGLAGVSVGYRLLNNIDIMVEPNFSQSLQPLTKSSSNFAATPSGLGISAGIRYNFRR